MSKVLFQFNNGHQRMVKIKMAEHLEKAGKGHIAGQGYTTRDMTAQRPAAATVLPARATPAAIKLAQESGVNLADVTGTGAGGNITVADVKNAAGA